MKLGLFMNTQWRQGADLGPELLNLIEQVRVARASGLASLMVGQHFLSSPVQMFQAMPLLSRLAAEARGMRLGPGLLLLPLLNPVIVAEETATLDWLNDGNAIISCRSSRVESHEKAKAPPDTSSSVQPGRQSASRPCSGPLCWMP